jgi:transcriptional regulator with XRE-family HTH domain
MRVIYTEEETARKVFGARLKRLTELKGYRYNEIAQKINVSASSISDIFNGRYFPALTTVFKLASELNTEYVELLEGVEQYMCPKGLKLDKQSPDFINNYYKAIEKKYARYEEDRRIEGDIVIRHEVTKGINELTVISKDELNDLSIDDDFMAAIGIRKGMTVSYKIYEGDFKNGGIYVVYLHESNVKLIRRIWEYDDKLILIPCSADPNLPIVEHHKNKVEILGTVQRVNYDI